MGRPGISYEQVANAADGLMGRGEKPSIRRIREHLGTGSPSTIQRHLKTWRSTQTQVEALEAECDHALTEVSRLREELERYREKNTALIEKLKTMDRRLKGSLAAQSRGQAREKALKNRLADQV